MALNLPDSPSLNDIYQDSTTGFSYQWDGSIWRSYRVTSTTTKDLVEDTSPQLGANLDLNSSNITGTGNINITGVVTATSFSGDGSALTGINAGIGTEGSVNTSGIITATSFVKSGGTSSQFLKADGSVDSSTYITSADGGNAGTLDGIDSSSFLRSDADDTMSGVLSLTSSTRYPLVIDGSDNGKLVLKGSSNPFIRFQETTTDKAYIQWSNAGYLQLGNQEDGASIRIRDDFDFSPDGSNFYTIWHANNDGSGSGLDADTLDGQEGSYYLNYNNFTNTPTIPTNNNQLTNGAGYITTSFTNTNQLTNGAGFITGTDNTTGTSGGLSGAPSITVTDITATGNVSIAGTLTYEDVTSIDSIGIVTARTGVRVTTGGLTVSAGGATVSGETSTTTLAVSSFSTFNGNTKHFDGKYANFGTGADLQIVHDGSNAVIQNGTGNFFIDNNASGGDILIRANDDISLRVDGNTTVLTAQSGGIDITGHIETDTLNVSGISTFQGNANIGAYDNSSATGAGVKLVAGGGIRVQRSSANDNNSNFTNYKEDTANFLIRQNGNVRIGGTIVTNNDATGSPNIKLNATDGSATFAGDVQSTDGTNIASINNGGTVYVNQATSNNNVSTPAFRGGSAAGGTTSQIFTDGSATFAGDILSTKSAGTIKAASSSDSKFAALYAGDSSNDSAVLWQNGALRFYNTTERMRIDSSGKVLIGTSTASNYDDRLLTVGNTSHTSPTIEIRSATNGQPGLVFSDSTAGDANSYRGTIEYNHTSNYMMFRTDAVERMRIDSVGRVMIGTTTEGYSSADTFTIAESGNCGLTIRSGTTYLGTVAFSDATSGPGEYAGYIQYSQASTYMGFGVGSSEKMRIDSSGRLLVGTTGGYGVPASIHGDAGATSTGTGSYVVMTVGDTSTAAQNVGGGIGFLGNDGVNSQVTLATIQGFKENATSGNYAGGIRFHTRENSSALTERLRITSTGLLLGGSDSESNTTLGGNAGDSMTDTAYYNTLIGQDAGTAMTTADTNTAVGAYALSTATTASMSCAFGHKALFSSDAWYNNAFGKDALENCSSGANNNAFGYLAMESHTTGANNCAFGDQALSSNTTSWSNSAFGAQALTSNTGASNTAVGRGAMYTNTSGYQNASVGRDSMYDNDTGINDAALGYRSLRKNTSGSDNVAIGRDSGYFNTTGSGNIVIGSCNSSGTYAPVFGLSTSNNRVVMGSTAVTNAYVQVAWTVVSDARDKMNFGTVPHGLEFIKQLNPVSFQFKFERDSDTPNGPVRYGFKAQDILALEGEDNSVIIDNDDPDKLRYNGEALVPVLVNAIKEQQTIIDTLIARLDAAGI